MNELPNTKNDKLPDVDQYVKGILAGDRVILSKAITIIESARSDHQEMGRKIVDECLPHSGRSIRIGITGIPGVGKSTFIEALGSHLTAKGHKLAVLAIDPSSTVSKGSILGDKTRMEKLAADENAYIRPTPTSGTLGGVAKNTRETMILCEAAGFDMIFVETVGVGQSETAVHSLVDFFLLLMLPGAGDELQGIKRGIMEMTDAIVINKADGDNLDKAKQAALQFRSALHLFPPTESGWIPKVETCSALKGDHIPEVWEIILEHHKWMKERNFFVKKRQEQAKFCMYETINEQIRNTFYQNEKVKKMLLELEPLVIAGKISPFTAAQKLLVL